MTRRLRLLLAAAAVVLCSALAGAAADDTDERALRAAGAGTDGEALLQFFRSRTVHDDDRDKIAALIKRLGDDEFDVREKASADLVAAGTRAEKQLRDALKNSHDPEVQRRAEACLGRLAKDKDSNPTLLGAAARLLGKRKPDGAAAVLLAYLPYAPGEAVANDVRGALAAVAVRDGKADPAIVKALDDKSPARRLAAAVALARAGAKDQLPALRKLLRDPEAAVRLRVAVALALAKDKEAVPALIDLLADLPQRDGYEAEDLLRALAGDKAPDVPLGKDDEARKKCRDAWRAWWKKNGDKADLAKLADGLDSGRTLLVVRGTTGKGTGIEGRVVEVSRTGEVLWQIDGLKNPVDAQPLPGGRVLVCEYTGRRITERNSKGEVLWEKTTPPATGALLSARRLPGGNLFVVTRSGLYEYDKDGKEVFSRAGAGTAIYAASRSRTGEVAYLTLDGTCVRLDKDGKEVASFPAGRSVAYGGIDLLPNGNVLVPAYAQNKVVEYDAKGKVVAELAVERPASAVRLPNGHTLVTALARRVVELDKDGKVVWKYESDGRPYKAYRH